MDSIVDLKKFHLNFCADYGERREHEFRLADRTFTIEPRRYIYTFYCIHCLAITEKVVSA